MKKILFFGALLLCICMLITMTASVENSVKKKTPKNGFYDLHVTFGGILPKREYMCYSDNRDVTFVYLLYSVLFGNGDYPVLQAGNFDGNSERNSDDAIYLLYHVLFGADDYPLSAE